MAKVTAPLLSFGASGQIGKAQVYGSWRGVDYARRYVTPANPRSTAQQLTRDLWSKLSTMWVIAPSALTDPWNLFAQGRQFTGQNRFMGDNVRAIRGESDMGNFESSPGVKSGFPLENLTADAGTSSGEIDVTASVPATPTDWTLTQVVFIAFPDSDPSDEFTGSIDTGTEDTAPYEHTFTGLDAGENYVISAYITWEKPNGDTAYGASSTVIQAAAS